MLNSDLSIGISFPTDHALPESFYPLAILSIFKCIIFLNAFCLGLCAGLSIFCIPHIHMMFCLRILVNQLTHDFNMRRYRLGNTFPQPRYRLMSTFFQLHFHSIALPYSAPFMTPFSLSDLLCSLLSHYLPLMSDCT